MKLYKWLKHPRKAHTSREPRSYLPQVRRSAALQVFTRPPKIKRPTSLPVARGTIKTPKFVAKILKATLPLSRLQRTTHKLTPTLKRGRTTSLLDIPQSNPKETICGKRKDRRHILFSTKIAGLNLHKSPGNGGTYNRTLDSQTSCRS